MLANSLSGEEIHVAREIINSLSLEYRVGSEYVLAVIHDCASTNIVRSYAHTESFVSPYSRDWVFFTHPGLCGGKIQHTNCPRICDILDQFICT